MFYALFYKLLPINAQPVIASQHPSSIASLSTFFVSKPGWRPSSVSGGRTALEKACRMRYGKAGTR